MRNEIWYLLLVSACFCEKDNFTKKYNTTKSLIKLNKHHHVNKTNNCRKLNCPTTEDLKCIKLKNKKTINSKEIHIIVLNKCEIDYIKCHDGLEATLVPMRNCDKPEIGNSDKKRPKRSPKIVTKTSKNNVTLKSRRYKIPYKSNRIDYSKLYFGPHRRENTEEQNEESGNTEEDEEIQIGVEGNIGEGAQGMMAFKVEEEVDDSNNVEEPDLNNGESTDQGNNGEVDQHDTDGQQGGTGPSSNEEQDSGIQYDEHDSNYNHDDASGHDNDGDDKAGDMNVDVVIDKEELKTSESETEHKEVDAADLNNEEPKTDGVNIEYTPPEFGQQMGTSIEVVDKNIDVQLQDPNEDSSTDESNQVSQKEERPIATDTSDDSDQENIQIDEQDDCPTECPARDVMVCARCKAGVYRTFLSVCHLRLFSCNHPEEKLELVSRRPCVLSAPYLVGMKTKGRQKDPNDEDIVLKYIRCREKGDANDPKCKFAKAESNDKRLRKI